MAKVMLFHKMLDILLFSIFLTSIFSHSETSDKCYLHISKQKNLKSLEKVLFLED